MMILNNNSKDNMNLKRMVIPGAMQCLARQRASQRQKTQKQVKYQGARTGLAR
jgi:hypothetical protein